MSNEVLENEWKSSNMLIPLRTKRRNHRSLSSFASSYAAPKKDKFSLVNKLIQNKQRADNKSSNQFVN